MFLTSPSLCSAWQCTTNTPCGRPEARIHMRVVQPAVLEDGHLSPPSLLLGRQDKHPSGPVCTGCCLPISVLLPFGIPAHYAWRNCEIAVINKFNMRLQCHNIAIKVISFWIAWTTAESARKPSWTPLVILSTGWVSGEVLPSFWSGVLFKMEQWHSARGCKKGPRLRTA